MQALMFDGIVRRQIDPLINAVSRKLAEAGVTANAVTLTGCALGLAAGVSIAFHHFLAAAALTAISRLCDGLDGGVAKIRGKTDFGGYLDIVLDFVFYGAIPVGFVFADPAQNAVPAAVLLFVFYINGASFLAYAIMAEKRKMQSTVRGEKSLFYTTGFVEATETIVVFILACFRPDWFPLLAWIFAAACAVTALSRIAQAWREFG
jgi:phosphatidylglycerophosphate synthase